MMGQGQEQPAATYNILGMNLPSPGTVGAFLVLIFQVFINSKIFLYTNDEFYFIRIFHHVLPISPSSVSLAELTLLSILLIHLVRVFFGVNFIDSDATLTRIYEGHQTQARRKLRWEWWIRIFLISSQGIYLFLLRSVEASMFSCLLIFQAVCLIAYHPLFWTELYRSDPQWRDNLFILANDIMFVIYALVLLIGG
jgi:hypothetical protein